MSSSDAQPWSSIGVVEAADHDVGDVAEAVGAQQVRRRGRGEDRQRVFAFDRGRRRGGARPARPRTSGPCSARADEQPADVRDARAAPPAAPGGARRSPPSSAGAARPSGRSGRGSRNRARRLAVDVVLASPSGRRARSPRLSAWPTMALCSSPPAIRGDLGAGERALDQVVERVAVALLEGRAHALAVVGEHDEVVGARRQRRARSRRPKMLVERAQHLQGVRPVEPGMVSDLVVGWRRWRRQRARPRNMSEITHEDDRLPDITAWPARMKAYLRGRGDRAVARRGASPGRGPLADDLADEEGQGPREGVAVREEGDGSRGVRRCFGVDPAVRADALVGARPRTCSRGWRRRQPAVRPRREPVLELGAVVRRRAADQPAGCLSNQRKAGMSALAPSRMPAWLAEVWEERSGSQLGERWSARRASGRFGAASRRRGLAQDRLGQPVDLQEDEGLDRSSRSASPERVCHPPRGPGACARRRQLVPVMTVRTIIAAAMTRAATSASANEWDPGSARESLVGEDDAAASANSTRRKPVTSVNGSRRPPRSRGAARR